MSQNTMIAQSRLREFLVSLNVEKMRADYAHRKTVELDMPKNVQAIRLMYEEYWKKKSNWLNYPEFYELYQTNLYDKLEIWRQKEHFSYETFYYGLPGRIYRTWFSVLTQIQGGYVAETIYGEGNVTMNVLEDLRGKDMIIKYKNKEIPVQIKKVPNGKALVRVGWFKDRQYINVEYEVPNCPPLTKAGSYRVPFVRWFKQWGTLLDYLPNGVVIFKEDMFKPERLFKEIKFE